MFVAFNVAELWDEISTRHHSDTAIHGAEETITYGDLDVLSERIALFFNGSGVKAGCVVALLSSKSVVSYAAMLASLKIGAIYVNLDPSSPAARLEKIFEVCEPSILCLDHPDQIPLAKSLPIHDDAIQMLTDSVFPAWPEIKPKRGFLNWLSPAYIMFTSGSTGVPKGVTVSHGGILSFIAWSRKRFDISENDRFAQTSPLYFDNSVFDFYSALFSGASLVPINADLLKTPVKLVETIREFNCSIWFSVPSLFVYLQSLRILQEIELPEMRRLIFGGEGFPKREMLLLYETFKTSATLTNVYGPTEGTCICSAYEITESDFSDMGTLAPLGKINPNFEYKIIAEGGQQAESGEKGELWISGPNLALGYYNDPNRTSLSFVAEQSQTGGARTWYRTGDLVYEEDGLLWFSGRIDNQIKHMGYRIELEEIEAAINSIEGVEQSGVIYDRTRSGHGRVVAFFQSHCIPDGSHITAELRSLLPSYMIPQLVIRVERLPKNRNGKVDRKALEERARQQESYS